MSQPTSSEVTRPVTTAEPLDRRSVLRRSALDRYERLVEIRTLEDRVLKMFADGLVPGTTHTAQGQEAVSVALAAVTEPTDWVTCTYRGHGHALALGMRPEQVFGEVLGRVNGSIGGVGGSMHLSERQIGLMPTFAIVGAGLPVAVGAAIAARHPALAADGDGAGPIGVALFGDGATNIGAFHEALNLASVWNVPTLFIIENNLYGEFSPLRHTTPIDDLHTRASSYAMDSSAVDGQDVEALATTMGQIVDQVRSTSRPYLLEVKTYRFAGHSRSDPATYRPDGELEQWQARDPLLLARQALVAGGEPEAALDQFTTDVHDAVEAAAQRALDADYPPLSAMFKHV